INSHKGPSSSSSTINQNIPIGLSPLLHKELFIIQDITESLQKTLQNLFGSRIQETFEMHDTNTTWLLEDIWNSELQRQLYGFIKDCTTTQTLHEIQNSEISLHALTINAESSFAEHVAFSKYYCIDLWCL